MSRTADSGSHIDEWAGFVGCDVDRETVGSESKRSAGENDRRD